ncbi:MAG: LuxR C-terminal-related transcriptional regulator [Oscillospiraceae bacterium]|nr:LuxR C-terminal-related transcriptional regulator [Oscillospiraceae bacterium]
MLIASAEMFLSDGMTKEAVGCFYRAGDYEAILSCDLVCLITERFAGVSYTELARTVLEKCPEDVQRRYPYSLLRLCYALYAGCAFDDFHAQMQRVFRLLERSANDPQLLGEWHLMNALDSFPDLDAMKAQYEIAESMMHEPSKVFVREEPFMFGCASMWYLFYAKPGTMLETADKLTDTMKIYNRLTNGHGAGAAEIYRGEAYSVQGRFEESDIQAYQAAFLSEQSGNATATYGAALLLGINAIYRSDMAGLQKAIDYLENKALSYSFLRGKALGTYMVETVRGYLLGLMMETGRSALWTQGEADSLADLTFTNFMIKTCRITDLLLKKEYKRAIASVEAALRLDSRLISTSTRNFMCCGLALSYLAIGRIFKAAEYLDQSLTLAGQDRNYTFLACFRKYFQVLFLMPQIAARHAGTIREINALSIRYTRADESHIFAVPDEIPELREDLTKREREVAELAAKGLRNPEIAEALKISENTVKHHLKIAFQKMNIDRRSKLIEMLR